MTSKQIDYCIELARTESFSKGADNLFVSQPTFSYQIKLLEDEVGFKIFERNGKGARDSVKNFIDILKDLYDKAVAFPL